MDYRPKPIDVGHVVLPTAMTELVEQLAEHSHDVWALHRLNDGWTCGPRRDDLTKQHPCLVPYAELMESDKEYERKAVIQALKAIIALGYRIGRYRDSHSEALE